MVARTCWSSSTTRIMSDREARGPKPGGRPGGSMASCGGLAKSVLVEPVECVGITVIHHCAAAGAGRRRRPPGRARDRRQSARMDAGPLDHRLLEPFAGIGAVEPVDPRADDAAKRPTLEIVDEGFVEEADGLARRAVHVHRHGTPHPSLRPAPSRTALK